MRFWYLTLSCQRSGIIIIDFQAKPDIWSEAPSSSDPSHVCFRSEERSLVGGNTAVSVTIDQKCNRVASDAFDSCNDRLLSGFLVQTRTNKGRKRRSWCRGEVDLWPFLIQKRHRFVILSLKVTLRRYWDIAFMKTGQKTIKHNDFSDGFGFCLL